MISIKATGERYLTDGKVFAKEIFVRDNEEYLAIGWKMVEDTEPELSSDDAVKELLEALNK